MSSVLSKIDYPADIRSLNIKDLEALAQELRTTTINAVAKTGGHLGAGLGVIELTIALHYVFDTPNDKIIWDVGHQTYPHKILTGRKNQINSLRQADGLSGFTKMSESIYDTFGAGHSSTSISAALGIAIARDLNKENQEVIAVIGDGALSAGLAYEALNNAGVLNSRLIIILNDNQMSISPAVGAMTNHLKFLSDKKQSNNHNAEENIFSLLNIDYLGPVDGHNLSNLISALKDIKNNKQNKPILLHVKTEKGHGFNMECSKNERLHAVTKFDINTKIQEKNIPKKETYTEIFGKSLSNFAESDPKIIAITAAMTSGTGLDKFATKFEERCFDVGIAEQHAVTFAAGLASQGYKPFFAVYSTFLQRAYDQVVHDVAVQSLPVRFAIDRAGLVGADGPTHAGTFDITYLTTLPNFVVMAPSDENELINMIYTSLSINDRPSAFRYKRGEARGIKIDDKPSVLPIGKGRIINNGETIAILSLGDCLEEVEKAANLLKEKHNLNITIADARFAKPLDSELIINLAKNHQLLITIEHGSIGGFGSHVAQLLNEHNLLTPDLKFQSLFLPDVFIEHDTMENMYKEAGLSSDQIAKTALNLLQKS